MIEGLLSLPPVVGSAIVIGLTVIIGLVTYLVSHRLFSARYQMEDMKDAAGMFFSNRMRSRPRYRARPAR
jgi:hypothetical protein